jgi:uncharacterized protein (TIGR03084 family)
VDAIVAALAEQHAELAGLLAELDDDDWKRPSPCEGWSVSDVVLHLAQTDELARASARGHLAESAAALAGSGFATDVDEIAERMVGRERGQPGSVVRERWQAKADELRRVFAASHPSRRVQWVTGEVSTRTLATTRLAETWIHTGDVGEALGRFPPPTDRLQHVARLAWRTLPYAFARAGRELSGPVAFGLHGPSGAAWNFFPDDEPVTFIRGDGAELCLVAARRVDPSNTDLQGEGPDAEAVLELLRTYA